MPDSVMSSYEMPPVNIMELLIGGPKSYFGRRGQMSDQIYLLNQEREMRGQFAQNLIGSPVFKQAIALPEDRAAQYGLWAATEAGPAAIANQGAQWLQSQLGYSNQMTHTRLDDALSRSRIGFSADEQIRVEKEKLRLGNQNIMDQYKMIFGTDPETGRSYLEDQQQRDMGYDFMAKQGFVKDRPEGYSISVDGGFVPTLGGSKWQDSMAELDPIQQSQAAQQELLDMVEGRSTWDRARASVLTQTVKDAIRKQKAFGSLDEGTERALQNYIPDVGGAATQYNPTGDWALTAREKLRALSIQSNQAVTAWERKWRIPLEQTGKSPYATSLPTRPAGSADKAVTQAPARGSGPVGTTIETHPRVPRG